MSKNQVNKKKYFLKKNIIVILVVLLVLIVTLFAYFIIIKSKNNSTQKTPTSNSSANDQTASSSFLPETSEEYQYEIDPEKFTINDVKYELQTNTQKEDWDQKIIKYDPETQEPTVIVESIKTLIPDLKLKFNLILKLFAQPDNSDFVIFNSIMAASDNPGAVLFKFDPIKAEFTEMKINDKFDGFAGGTALATNQTRFIWAPMIDDEGNARTIYLMDLVNDSYRTLINLPDKENLNGGSGGMSSHLDISWLDNQRIKYAVYDQTKKQEGDIYNNDYLNSILIEYRELDV